jgi:MFS family permease
MILEIIFKRFQPGIWILTLVGLLNAAAFSISLPFLALYLFENRGVSMAMVGVIMMVSGSISAVSQLFAGTITDRLGRRPLLLITVSLSGILYTGMALLIGAAAPVIAVVAVYVLVRSVLMMQRPPIQAMVADLAPKEKLTEAYSLWRVGGNLGWAAGPAIGGFLAASLTYAWLFGIGALIACISLIFIFFFLRESFSRRQEKVNIGSIISAGKDRSLLIFTVLSMLVFLVMGQIGSTLSVYTVSYTGFTTTQYGSLLTLNGLLVVVFQYPFSRLMERKSHSVSLILGGVLFGFGYLIMAWVGGYGLAIGAMVLITAAEIVFAPTTLAVVGEMASGAWRGRYMAFFGLSETVGMTFGMLLGGILLDSFAYHPLYVWGTISLVAFSAALGFSRFRIKERNIEQV